MEEGLQVGTGSDGLLIYESVKFPIIINFLGSTVGSMWNFRDLFRVT